MLIQQEPTDRKRGGDVRTHKVVWRYIRWCSGKPSNKTRTTLGLLAATPAWGREGTGGRGPAPRLPPRGKEGYSGGKGWRRRRGSWGRPRTAAARAGASGRPVPRPPARSPFEANSGAGRRALRGAGAGAADHQGGGGAARGGGGKAWRAVSCATSAFGWVYVFKIRKKGEVEVRGAEAGGDMAFGLSSGAGQSQEYLTLGGRRHASIGEEGAYSATCLGGGGLSGWGGGGACLGATTVGALMSKCPTPASRRR